VGRSNQLFVFALPQGAQNLRLAARVIPPQVAPPAVAAQAAAASSCRTANAAESIPLASRVPATRRFSAAQVESGKKLFVEQQCASCHGPAMGGTPGAPSLNDAGFREAWRGKSANTLLDCMRTTMPPGRQGTLNDAQYVDLLAAILQANGIAPGDQAMSATPAELSRIALEAGR
jgi:mono/diheme cytochrome c family protein